ncbi:MAG: diguanylate cyclase domain-containing protein [Candidatus Scatovivens sp.]
MAKDIFIIDDKKELIVVLRELFKNQDYEFKTVSTDELEIALKNIPAMIIIDEDNIDKDIIDLTDTIKNNEDNRITPIIVISSNAQKEHRVKALSNSVLYYIIKPIYEKFLYYTVNNIINLLEINRRVSPLTGLPGNVQIQAEMKKRLLNKEVFAMVYFDLDNFKAYNDVYGFSNGDEIIKFTARVINKYIHEIEDSNNFVGHVGGDDFVAVISKSDYDKLCTDIIHYFDSKIIDYYSQEDIERGYVEVANRKGIIEKFPLVAISIGIVEVDSRNYKNTLEIGEIGAQVKHQAKTVMGSSYVINKRKF